MASVPSTIKDEGNPVKNLLSGLFKTGVEFLGENLFGGDKASQLTAQREAEAVRITAQRQAATVAAKPFGLSTPVLIGGAAVAVGLVVFVVSR